MRRITNIGLFLLISAFMPMGAIAKDSPPKNRISESKAKEIATKAYAGEVQGDELEFEDGKWIYSFDLKKAGEKNVQEVHIDAVTGKVLSMHVETPSDEKKESAEESESEDD